MTGLVLKIYDGVNTRQIQFFDEFECTEKYDAVADPFGFKFLFDPNNPDHAELACVTHYHECEIYFNDELMTTGYIINQKFVDSSKPEMCEIGGYSKAGVIEDCDIDTSNFPLQTDGLSLRQIVEKLIKPFGGKRGIKLVVDKLAAKQSSQTFSTEEKLDRDISKSTAPESKNIKSYLTDLATQRGIVLSHTPGGDLLITDARTDVKVIPILDFDPENARSVPFTRMELSFNGQALHSHITAVMQQDDEGGNAAEATVKNAFVPIVYRPKVVSVNTGDDITVQEAARNEVAKELKNIPLIITLSQWTDINGKLIRANNIVTVKNRKVYQYEKTRWFIQDVKRTGNAKEQVCTLTCVPVAAYDTGPIKNTFVDPHKNLPRV